MRNLFKLLTVILFFSCNEDPVIYTLTATANPVEGGSVSPYGRPFSEAFDLAFFTYILEG